MAQAEHEAELARLLTARGYALIETHISRVFVGADDVLKTKRPVELGFLDFSTLAAREQACEAEVRLNARLAPDVYLGVVGLVRDEEGQLAFVAKSELRGRAVLDWAVHMRRLSDDERADVLLARGALGRADMAELGLLLARFHGEARADEYTAQFAAPDVIARNVEENFAQVSATIRSYLAERECDALARAQRTFLAEHEPLLRARAARGRGRDGHGDLRLEHVYRTRERGFVIIDCIEFNERFRFADVCADLAFLVMDLAYHGAHELAEQLVRTYACESGDYELYALLDFYESYRACVRAKIASLLAEDEGVSADARERAKEQARRYYLLALSAFERPLVPARIVAVTGLIASGKSTLAESIAERLSLPVLSADRTRKRLLGSPDTEAHRDAAFAGAYSQQMSGRVYGALLENAEHVVRSGRSVVLDASFRTRACREQLCTLARELGAELTFVECRCPRELAMERLRRRAEGPSVSDGRAEIYDDFASSFEPLADELAPACHLVLDTSRDLETNLVQVLARIAP